MRFAEVFLRLGSSLVGWMVIYAHFLWLAVLFRLGCGPDGDAVHKVLLGLAPLAVGFALALRATRPIQEVHSILRWLGVPLVLLSPFIGRSIWQAVDTVFVNELSFCAAVPPKAWQIAWAPIQILAVLLVLYMVWRMWRSVSEDTNSGVSP